MAGLKVFPGELWELILDQLDDSKDIQSVLIAIPDLDELFQKKKSNWLIDQVFPYIHDQLNFNFKPFFDRGHDQKFLPLRLVSRRWCKVIDTFFQDHPSRRPYNSNQSRRSLPYPNFVYRDIEALPTFILRTPAKMRAEAEKIRGHSFNPFLYREVKLLQLADRGQFGNEEEYPDFIDMRDEVPPEDFLDACVLFLEEFGHHIWYLTLEFEHFSHEDVSSVKNIFGKILTCLSHVSNLRSLNILVSFSIIEEEMSKNFIKQLTFPPLQHLEALRSDNDPGYNPFLNALLEKYSKDGGLKLLEFPVHCMEPVHKICSANPSQLHVNDVYANTFPMFQRMLDTLDCSSLKKLKVTLDLPMPLGIMNLDHLFRIISPFPIEELELDFEDDAPRVVWCPTSNAEIPTLLSLKWFRFQDFEGLNLEFLKAMPKLEHLDIIGNNTYLRRINLPVDFSPGNLKTFSTQLRWYVYLSNSRKKVNIWEQLPELKALTVENQLSHRRFFREYGNKLFRNKLIK